MSTIECYSQRISEISSKFKARFVYKENGFVFFVDRCSHDLSFGKTKLESKVLDISVKHYNTIQLEHFIYVAILLLSYILLFS